MIDTEQFSKQFKNPIIPNIEVLKKYSLTEDSYYAILLSQEYRCAICKRLKRLVIDHCHKTGKTRQLLCSSCNTAIGFLEDDHVRALSASKYLKRHAKFI